MSLNQSAELLSVHDKKNRTKYKALENSRGNRNYCSTDIQPSTITGPRQKDRIETRYTIQSMKHVNEDGMISYVESSRRI